MDTGTLSKLQQELGLAVQAVHIKAAGQISVSDITALVLLSKIKALEERIRKLETGGK